MLNTALGNDGFKLTVDLPDFRRQIRQLGDRVEKRVVRGAMRDAAKVFRAAAVQRAPVLQQPDSRRMAGTLRRAIAIISPRRGGKRGTVRLLVSVRAATKARVGGPRDPFYWRWLEGGWMPRGPGQKLRGGSERRRLRRRYLLARGARRVQYPFLEPAFRQSGSAALAAFTRGMEKRIAEAERAP